MLRCPPWTNYIKLHQTRSINLIEIFEYYLRLKAASNSGTRISVDANIFCRMIFGDTASRAKPFHFFYINNAWSKISWEVKVQIKAQMTRKIHACFDGCSHMNGNHGQEPSRCNEKCGVMSAPCSFWGRPFLGNTVLERVLSLRNLNGINRTYVCICIQKVRSNNGCSMYVSVCKSQYVYISMYISYTYWYIYI